MYIQQLASKRGDSKLAGYEGQSDQDLKLPAVRLWGLTDRSHFHLRPEPTPSFKSPALQMSPLAKILSSRSEEWPRAWLESTRPWFDP